jgi:RNA polymerase sigma-70 factor, ECF subfamily
MDTFLQSVEKKAYQMAIMATHHQQDALDIVQNSMINLVRFYGDKPRDEWRPLFYRILQNEIKNWANKQSLFKKWFSSSSSQSSHIDGESDQDLADYYQEQNGQQEHQTPEHELVRQQLSVKLLKALEQLPLKQQQCFLLRSWEGLSVADTANAMSCSEGTVKTHMSRASQKLKMIIEGEHP